jgi:hypothetical protein
MEKLGFVITRSIREKTVTFYWRECVSCIRKFYTEKILIIDDNSTFPFDIQNEEKEFENIQVINSEFQGAGEILAYYYSWKLNLFEITIVLHDSMFIQDIIPEIEGQIKFLWNFDQYLYNGSKFKELVSYLPLEYNPKILELYSKINEWTGCFGICSIIKQKFLNSLFDKYKLQNMLPHLKLRSERESIERLFGIIAYLEEPQLKTEPSICGNILDLSHKNAWNYNWVQYIEDCSNHSLPNLKIIKLWSGR